MKKAAVLCFGFLLASTASAICPANFQLWYDGVCGYTQVHDSEWAYNYETAMETCRSIGGDLPSIHSQRETTLLWKVAVASTGQDWYSNELGSFWIGLQCSGDMNYTWTDGTNYDYGNFLSDFDSNQNKCSSEFALVMMNDKSDNKWRVDVVYDAWRVIACTARDSDASTTPSATTTTPTTVVKSTRISTTSRVTTPPLTTSEPKTTASSVKITTTTRATTTAKNVATTPPAITTAETTVVNSARISTTPRASTPPTPEVPATTSSTKITTTTARATTTAKKSSCGEFEITMPGTSKCLKVFADAKSWTEAENVCLSYGAHLASINSGLENDFIRRTSVANGLINGVHIGLHLQGPHPYDWMWSDGSDMDFTNFKNGNPNADIDSCTKIRTIEGYWENVGCNNVRLPFICELS